MRAVKQLLLQFRQRRGYLCIAAAEGALRRVKFRKQLHAAVSHTTIAATRCQQGVQFRERTDGRGWLREGGRDWSSQYAPACMA